MTPNHAFSAWFEWDQALLSWINATLSDFAFPYIVGKETANDVWESLEHRCGSLTCSHVIELQRRMQHVKKGSSTMLEYLYQLKVISDQLATCGSPVNEDDLILHSQVFLLFIDHFKPRFAHGQGMIQFL
ncbi:hypothetical protein AAC387_Pa10g0471 [Persea americana]